MKNVAYIFVDASNVWNAVKSTKKFIEYKNFRPYFKEIFSTEAVEVFYYDAYPKEGTRNYDLGGKHRFYTYLKKGLGFTVRKKELKRISVVTFGGEVVIEKGNMDVELVIDAMHYSDKYDIAVLFTGDADFLALINYLRSRGKKVFVYSTRDNISYELRTSADGYFDLKDVKKIWGKDLRYRNKETN